MDHPLIRRENLIHAFAHDLFCYGYWLSQDRAFAESLVRDTFTQANRVLHHFHERQEARFWLFNHLRRDCLKVILNLHTQPPPVLPALNLFEDYGVGDLHQVLHRFPLPYRELLVLQVLGGFEPREIAQLTDSSLATVTHRLTQVRRWLRDWNSHPESVLKQGKTR